MKRQRGVMLFAVVVVLAVAALAVCALSVAQEAEYAGEVAAYDQTQQRAVAWSGAQAVASLLAEQREAIATGKDPDLPAELTLWESEGQSVVVRVLPLGPMGERTTSESAKRALSALTAGELALTGVVNSAAAAAAIARRSTGDSIEALVDARAGLPPSVVLGPVVTAIADGVRAAQEGDSADANAAARPLALVDVVTPFDAQRALAVHAAAGASEIQARVPLADEWSDEAVSAIDAASAPGVAGKIREALADKAPANETELVNAMIKAKVEPAAWSGVLGAVICNAHGIEVGRVDASRASEAVLRTLPGISAEKASRWFEERESLDEAERMRVAWPVEKQVLTPEEFAAVAPHLASNSWLWRVRLITGVLDKLSESGTLQGVQVWDVVIDLAESPPRFASLRDSTLLPIASGLAASDATLKPDSGKERTADGFAEDNLDPDARKVEEPVNPPKDASPAKDSADSKDSKEWRSLGEEARKEREARNRAEAERRAANRAWSSSTASELAAGARDTTRKAQPAAPNSGAEGASNSGAGGRSASDAPTADNPAGGLSGRWRARGWPNARP